MCMLSLYVCALCVCTPCVRANDWVCAIDCVCFVCQWCVGVAVEHPDEGAHGVRQDRDRTT